MKQVTSPDISVLDFAVIIDMSTATPTARVINQSIMANPGNLSWAFELTTPFGNVVHEADIEDPDIEAPTAFGTYTFSESLPLIFGQLEFNSSTKYSVKVFVKDSQDNVFDYQKGQPICKPNGNNGKNNFGVAIVEAEAKCERASLFVTDRTNYLYKGLTGTRVSTEVKLGYPKDDMGAQATAETANSLPCILPLKVEGEGHNLYVANVYEYNLGNDFKVWVRYSFNDTFPIWCSVNLCPLFCELDKLADQVKKNCDSPEWKEQSKNLHLISMKLHKAVVGKMQPLCKFDVPKIVQEIKEIGGFDCDCCYPRGIFSVSNVLTADLNFTVENECGDIFGEWNIDDNGNVQLKLRDKSYVLALSEAAGNSAALKLTNTNNGCTKTTYFYLDKALLAQEILTEIQNNPSLVNILNTLITNTQLSCPNLSGGDVFNGSSCDYAVTIITGILPITLVSIAINGVERVAPDDLFITDAAGVQSWLNSLSLGTFSVVYSDLTNTTVITSTNTNSISTITIEKADQEFTQPVKSNCGSICNVLQAILNYLNNINLLQVNIGGNIKVCTIVKGELVEQEFSATDSAFLLAQALSNATCAIANVLTGGDREGLSGRLVSNSFGEFTPQIGDPNGADVIFGKIGGKMVAIPLKNAAKGIFQLLCTDAEVKSVYCQCGKCTTVADCNSVTGITSSVGNTTAVVNWNVVVGAIGYKYSIDGINYSYIIGTSASITGLTASTSYTFRIFPVYNSGDGIACQVTHGFITTGVSSCAAPTGFAVSEIGPNTAKISWNAVTGASGYQYQLDGGSWINVGTALENTLFGLADDTTFNVKVRAIVGGVPCTEESSESFETLIAGYFAIDNNVTNTAIITDVTPGTFYDLTTGTLPVNPAGIAFGDIITPYASSITVTVSTATCELQIWKNGIMIDNITAVIGANVFDPISFGITDNIQIIAVDIA